MRIPRGRWRCAPRDAAGTAGTAAVEFALLGPLLLLLSLGAYDLGNALQQSMRLAAAAQAGGQYAFAHPTDAAGITATVTANLAGWSNVTVAPPTLSCRCDDGSSVSCAGGGCTSGNGVPILYVTVAVTRPFTPLLPLTAGVFAPLSPLHGNAQIRLH